MVKDPLGNEWLFDSKNRIATVTLTDSGRLDFTFEAVHGLVSLAARARLGPSHTIEWPNELNIPVAVPVLSFLFAKEHLLLYPPLPPSPTEALCVSPTVHNKCLAHPKPQSWGGKDKNKQGGPNLADVKSPRKKMVHFSSQVAQLSEQIQISQSAEEGGVGPLLRGWLITPIKEISADYVSTGTKISVKA